MKKKGKSKTSHKKSEKKGEFESLVFLKRYSNCALTHTQNIPKIFKNMPIFHNKLQNISQVFFKYRKNDLPRDK